MTISEFDKLVYKFYEQASSQCTEGTAWEFEKHFARVIIEHCAMITYVCNENKIPLVEVSGIIRNIQND